MKTYIKTMLGILLITMATTAFAYEASLPYPYDRNYSPPSNWALGTKQVLFIRADFSDKGNALTQSVIESGMEQVRQKCVAMSYGLTDMVITVTPTIYHLPHTAAYYNNAGWVTIANDMLSAASADYPLDALGGAYDRIGFQFPNLNKVGFRGVRGNKWFWILGGANGNTVFPIFETMHEIGHTYGSGHDGYWLVTDGNPVSPNGSIKEYGNPFTIMGDTGGVKGSFSSKAKQQFGWINSQFVTSSGVYRVYSLDNPATVGTPKGLKIATADGGFYWVEFHRNFNGATSVESNGVNILKAFDDIPTTDTILYDMNTIGTGLTDAALKLLQIFNDGQGISIQLVNKGGIAPEQWMEVQITIP